MKPMTVQTRKKAPKSLKPIWFERTMAIAALLNLVLILFDLTYIPWRALYLKPLPDFTQWYGSQFKGIEPHRTTEAYLKTVEALEEEMIQTGVQSPQSTLLLDRLRTQSAEMIEEDPFQTANKSGTLERIKRRMREQTGQDSSKQAFELFWSQPYLSKEGWNP
jgi:hypothetical protein